MLSLKDSGLQTISSATSVLTENDVINPRLKTRISQTFMNFFKHVFRLLSKTSHPFSAYFINQLHKRHLLEVSGN